MESSTGNFSPDASGLKRSATRNEPSRMGIRTSFSTTILYLGWDSSDAKAPLGGHAIATTAESMTILPNRKRIPAERLPPVVDIVPPRRRASEYSYYLCGATGVRHVTRKLPVHPTGGLRCPSERTATILFRRTFCCSSTQDPRMV